MKPMVLRPFEKQRLTEMDRRRDVSARSRLNMQVEWAARVLYPAMIYFCTCPECESQLEGRELSNVLATASDLRSLAQTDGSEPTCSVLPQGGFATWRSLAAAADQAWSDDVSWEQIRDSAPCNSALRKRVIYPLELGLHDGCYERLLNWLAPMTLGACGVAWMPMDGPHFTWEGSEVQAFEASLGELMELIQNNDGYPPNTCWSLGGEWGIANDRIRHYAAVGLRSIPTGSQLSSTGLECVALRPEDLLP